MPFDKTPDFRSPKIIGLACEHRENLRDAFCQVVCSLRTIRCLYLLVLCIFSFP